MGKASAVTHLKARRQPRSQSEDGGFFPDMARDQLLKLAKTYLAERGVEWSLATKLGIEPLNGTEIKTLLGYRRHDAALKIIYRSLTGKPLGFWRLRYLGDSMPVNGEGDAIRYQQAKDTAPELYIPAVPGVDWKAIFEDTSKELVVTEGEVKAICATVRGIPTLALGGVWSFRSAAKGIDILPALKAIAWRGRRVTIVFDSDLTSNPDVRRAQGYLAEALTQLGAVVYIQNVPAPAVDPDAEPTGKLPKAGLDDFMVRVEREGGDAAQAVREEILTPAEEYAGSAALWAMNQEAAVLHDTSSYLIFDGTHIVNRQQFINTAFADRKYTVFVEGAEGERPNPKVVRTAQVWNEWPHRLKVRGIVYEPGKPRFVDGHWNAWEGWGIEPRPGDAGWWLRLAEFVCKREPKTLDSFIKWWAFQLQQPGRLTFGMLLQSVTQGTGKTGVAAPFVGDPVQGIKGIFGKNAAFVRSDHVHASFNDVLAFKQLVQVEEVSATRSDRRQDADRFKNIVYSPQISINKKYQPEIVIRNTINLYLTSNRVDALFLDRTDRRWFVVQAPHEKAKPEFYARYFRAAADPRNVAALFHYLLNEVDISDFNPMMPPTTDAKLAMMGMSATPLGAWVAQLREDPLILVRDRKLDAKEEDVPALWTADQLAARARLDLNNDRIDQGAVGRELADQGFEQVHNGQLVTLSAGRKRLWAIREVDKWCGADHDALAAEWERSHQKPPKPKKKF